MTKQLNNFFNIILVCSTSAHKSKYDIILIMYDQPNAIICFKYRTEVIFNFFNFIFIYLKNLNRFLNE